MGDAESGALWLQAAKAYMYVLTWMSISCAVIMFNKWVLAYSGFPFPLSLIMWHMIFCSALSFLLVRVFKVVKPLGMPQKDYIHRVMPIGALYAASLWLSNSAYLHLSVSFIQMTKALMPGLVYCTGVYMGTEKLTAVTSLNMIVIAIGVAIAAYGELHIVLIGVYQQLSALVFEATRLMLVQVLMNSQGYTMNPIQSLYYVSPACLFCLSIPWLAVELPQLRMTSGLQIDPLIFLANAATAFLLNIAVFMLIGQTSALTMNIAGVIKDWILIWMSMSVFKSPITELNLFGYFIAFLAVMFYNYKKLVDAKQREAAKSKLAADVEAPADGAKQSASR
mmetsp:Transcript_12155/g.39980  ORF Transcript_12155/g.39980 Transcript_12155/m.39980 type:complete len:337 (+) Transcript_12155:83-1093(+)